MEKQYRHFKLKEGNLIDHRGGAIVLPSFSSPTCVVGAMAGKFYDQLQAHGMSVREFRERIWHGMHSQDIPELSALFIKKPTLVFPYDVILSGCVQCAYDYELDEKARIATRNALEKAAENGTTEIAFPILLTGGEGGLIEKNAPAMAGQFYEFNQP